MPRPREVLFCDDTLHLILSHSGLATLGAAEQVCRSWRGTLKSVIGEELWRAQCAEVWRERTQWACGGLPPSRHALQRTLLDASRQTITPEELSTAVWCFRFVGPDLAHEHRTTREREEHAGRPRGQLSFGPDGLYTSTMPGAPSASRPLPWRISFEGRCVRIASYPPLKVSRAEDCGWQMRNEFVEFYTESCRPHPHLFSGLQAAA